MNEAADFWDALAPHHAAIEDNYLDRSSLRRIIRDVRQPVLVVGAGQGLIVEALQKEGLRVAGVDLSAEMIRCAKSRRGLTLLRADARAMPFGDRTYETILYATGVIDFIGEDAQIQTIAWTAKKAEAGYLHATRLLLQSWVFSTAKEKAAAFSMQRIFRNQQCAESLINAAPEGQPYRNEHEIRNLFARLAIPIRRLEATASCRMAEL